MTQFPALVPNPADKAQSLSYSQFITSHMSSSFLSTISDNFTAFAVLTSVYFTSFYKIKNILGFTPRIFLPFPGENPERSEAKEGMFPSLLCP